MLDPRLSMSYFDAPVYNKVEIVGTTIKTCLELHRLTVKSLFVAAALIRNLIFQTDNFFPKSPCGLY